MQEGYNSNVIPPANNDLNPNSNNGPTIVKTDVGAKDGHDWT